MKFCLAVGLLCLMFSEIFGVVTVTNTPIITTVGLNTVNVQMPYCYFDSFVASGAPAASFGVYIVVSLTSATSQYDKVGYPYYDYSNAFTATGNPFYTAIIKTLDCIPCSSTGIPDFIVGSDGACTTSLCNGVLPEGRDVSFKFILGRGAALVAETPWTQNVALPVTIVDFTPTVSTDVARPVTVNTASLQMPYCYFDSYTKCPDPSKCEVWLVSSLTSAKSNYDTNISPVFFSEYPTAFTATGIQYSTTLINSLDKIPCPATAPYNFLVGADGRCSVNYCNGVFPESENMSFKYVLVIDGDDVAETKWSDNVKLNERKSPDSLGGGYAGRSGAMVAITTILSIFIVLLFSLLLTLFILLCCCQKGETESYGIKQKPPLVESLRVPSYDVHHLKNSSQYDNPAYDQQTLKNRNQKTTTTINQV